MRSFLNRLNTHTIFGVGAGTFLVGVASLFLKHPIDATIAAHTSAATQVSVIPAVNGWLDNLAAPALVAGGVMLGQGRPPSVPSGPVKGG